MDKTSLLTEIKTALEGLLNHAEKLEKGGQPLHQIDKDVLLEKTRHLYEQMMALENAGKESEHVPEPETEQKTMPAVDKIAEEIRQKEEVIEEKQTVEVAETEQEKPVEEIKEEVKTDETPVTEEIPVAPAKEEPVEEKPEPVVKTEQPVDPPKTTLDLFSAASKETLGETLKPSEKPAIADSLQKSGINDLREAIGINDKFLFVNELFNGDLEQYNKVIDELNSFSGLSGAQTYLAELQVQYQWTENSPAFQKLNSLLERKFA